MSEAVEDVEKKENSIVSTLLLRLNNEQKGEISPGIRISLIFLFRLQPETSPCPLRPGPSRAGYYQNKNATYRLLGCYSI